MYLETPLFRGEHQTVQRVGAAGIFAVQVCVQCFDPRRRVCVDLPGFGVGMKVRQVRAQDDRRLVPAP